MLVKTLAFLFSFVLVQVSLSCPTVEDRSDSRFRLPTNVKPISYDITLRPDLTPLLEPAPFYGSVKIRIAPTEETNVVTLLVRRLSIDDSSVRIEDLEGNVIDIDNIARDEGNELYIITTKEQLLVSAVYVVVIESYEGTLNLENAGFYLAKYMEDGVEKRLATTQFQSTSARRAFPSFDEPAFKATFNVTLLRPSDFHSISNEILLETTDLGDGLSKDIYRESVVMSTYLVAFVVSQYEYVQKEDQRVFARPEAVRAGWCEYALETGLRTISVLEEFLGVEYTLDKMDQVAIPDAHFSPGAMENWGLVTYRESYLLYSEEYSTTQQLQRICTVIAHEFAHQWFGNLVTLQWWSYTWLNEGFATYFEMYASSLVETSWRLMDQFLFDVHNALEFDSTNSTTPMNYENAYGGGAPSLITYEKGGSVLRMAENFLGAEVFRRSLNVYLNDLQFSSSTPQHLYDAIQETVDALDASDLLGGYTVNDILSPWTDQEGHPMVTVTRSLQQISLAQRRFLLKNYTDVNVDQLWPVPINFMFSTRDGFDFSKTTADFWFTEREETLSEEFPTDGFVIANKQQTGFYRVNYDLENWNKIIDHLTSESYDDIVPLNRAQLIDDIFNFAKSGVIHYDVALDLSTYILRETDYIPMKAFLGEVDYLKTKVAFSSTSTYFNAYILDRLNRAIEQLGFYDKPTDDHVTKLNRVAVMTQACNLGKEDCLSNSLDAVREWIQNDSSTLTPDMQQYAFCSALRVGNEEDWSAMYQRYLSEDMEFLKLRILSALGCAGIEQILVEYMNQIIDDDGPIRKIDRQSAFAAIYNSGSFGLGVAFEYLADRFDDIRNSSLNINSIISGIGDKLNTAEHREKLLLLAETHGYNYFGATLRVVEENIAWNEEFLPVIHNWFVNNKK